MLLVRRTARLVLCGPVAVRAHLHTAPRLLAPRAEPQRARIQHRQNGRDFTDSFHLADRVKLLAQRDQLESALDLVKTSPSHAANVVVWNVLINSILQAKKYKTAYTTWMDMKRRGLKPTARSYGTFLSGFARVRGEVEGGTLSRVKTVFAQWLLHAERVIEQAQAGDRPGSVRKSILEEEAEQETVDSVDDLTSIPTNHYLSFLAHTDNVPLLLETFEAMPAEGPLAPTSMTYSIVLGALRTTSADNPEHFQAALKLWQRMLEVTAELDTKTVSIIISICREAKRPDDQRIGLQVAKDFYGLVDPAEEDKLVDHKTLPLPPVAMDSAALSNVFSLALAMQQYNLVVRWFDQVRDYPKRFGADLVDHHQCELVLVALAAKHDAGAAEDLISWMRRSASPSVQPTLASYTNAIQVCWRSADLVRAYRLLSLMVARPIGPEAVASTDPSSPTPPTPALAPIQQPSTPTSAKKFQPDDRILSTLLQTSLATRDRGNIYRTLSIVEEEFNRPASYYPSPSTSHSLDEDSDHLQNAYETRLQRRRLREDPHAPYWKFKLAEVLERCLERVLQGGEGHLNEERRKTLAEWRTAVVKWLEAMDSKGVPKVDGVKEEESMRSRREVVKAREEVFARRHARKAADASEEQDPWRSDAPRTSGPRIRRSEFVQSPYQDAYKRPPRTPRHPTHAPSSPQFDYPPPAPRPRKQFNDSASFDDPRRAAFSNRDERPCRSFSPDRKDGPRRSFESDRPSPRRPSFSRDDRDRDAGPPRRSFERSDREERPRRNSYSGGGGSGGGRERDDAGFGGRKQASWA